jgi:4-hydroxy-tetrahydrodipicolinate reductase
MEALRILLVGASGRMGQAVINGAGSQPNSKIAAHYRRGDVLDEKLKDVNVVIDFSSPALTEMLCRSCTAGKIPLVSGTTGHSVEEREAIDEAAKAIPVILAANFSIGVNVLFALSRLAAKGLGAEFKIKIVETHHVMKKDAPSGTAKTISQILHQVRGDSAEIPIQSIREGEVVGEHSVIFSGSGEEIELKHSALNREIFALGAWRAASWIVGKPAGLYSMEDVLGL